MKNGPYEMLIAPPEYPGKKYRGRYVYEHHFKWWKLRGQVPPKGYEIHHKNGNHRDNRISNLQLVTAHEHRKLHGAIAKTKAQKNTICGMCNKNFVLSGNVFRTRLKNNITGKMYCSRECQWVSMEKCSALA